jgi:sorting nexin-1/2
VKRCRIFALTTPTMSGFDDLLQQSSRALEENPFEDPFARPRASSPDPWSTYTHQSAAAGSPAFEYDTSGFGSVSTTTQALESHDESVSPAKVGSYASVAPTIPSDPLDSANLPADDEMVHTTKPATSPRLSSFVDKIGSDPPPIPSQPSADSSESVPEPEPPRAALPTLPSITSAPTSPPLQPSSPISPSSAVPADSVEQTDPPSPPPPSSARLPRRQEAPHPSIHVPFDSSSSTESDSHRVISTPLDQPPVTAFASLALGGESFNGWDGSQSAFVNHASIPSFAQEEDDDDDDDKPLRPRPVSTSFYSSVDPIHRRSCFRRRPQKRRKLGYSLCSRLLSKIHKRLEILFVRSLCTQFTPRHVPSEFGCVSAVLNFLPDHLSGIFKAFVFCSSPLLRLPVAV